MARPKNLLSDIKSVFKQTQHYNFCLEHGINMRDRGGFTIPSYQRGIVWDETQQIKFIESIWLGLPIGSYIYATDTFHTENFLLDGQQRWNSIYRYIEDSFRVFDKLYSELESPDVLNFKSKLFPGYIAKDFSESDQREIYERLAYGGTANTKAQETGEVRKLK